MNTLDVQQLFKSYSGDPVLKDIHFHIKKGECLGLVGASGCGKSTLARCLLGIETIEQGEIFLNQKPFSQAKGKQLRAMRKEIQAVLQHPSAALNPKLKIKDSLVDPIQQYLDSIDLTYFSYVSEKDFVNQLLDLTGLPRRIGECYPHELSGGQKQRVTIARAISIEPSLIVCDEPTASLDVSSQASLLTLLSELREELGLSYLFISHDLAAVYQISQRIMVMNDGEIIDRFSAKDLLAEGRHEHTKQFLQVFM
ncbi:ABC transporter ATP-binding protein [Bacillus sp. SW14]|uniref:ABC transporter ATP-binding protein n=1 Tax=Bacillus sp. SW14 TaxID=3391618 RepID=UPI0039E2AB0F